MRTRYWTVCLLFLTLVPGCRPKAAPCWVQGQVRFDGQPVSSGSLRMDPLDRSGSPGGASKIVDGRYDIPRERRMLAGRYSVRAMAVRSTGRKIRNPERLTAEAASHIDEQVQYLPTRYNEQSEIVVELLPGANVLDFDWKSP